MPRMSGKNMRFQVPPKTFWLDGRIMQRIWQWVPNRRTGDWESPQVPNVLRRNRGIFSLRRLTERTCWRPETSESGTQQSARYIEARYWRVAKTPINSHSRRVLHPLWNRQSVQIITQQPWKTTLVFLGSCDQTLCSVLNQCNLSVTFFCADARTELESWCDKRMNQSLYWFNVQRARDTSHLTKLE